MSDGELAARLLARLRRRGWQVGVAESLTGGLVAASLVAVPGASASLRGAIVAYTLDVKHALLGVDAALLKREGAVHPDVARQMADGVRRALRPGLNAAETEVQMGIATTGVAGPDSPDGQPVGTVHVSVSTPQGTTVASLRLAGSRDEIRAGAVEAALSLALTSV